MTDTEFVQFLSAPLYASAVLATVLCLSVTSGCSIETYGLAGVLTRMLSSTYRIPRFKEIHASTKIT